jgi:branched-chain amino acid transport system ATP-binding protein
MTDAGVNSSIAVVTADAPNVLEVRDIHTFIGQFHILEGVSVTVPRGSVTVLLGRNGAGKTTTLKSILGLTPPRSGEIIFEGRSLAGMRPYRIARLGIGYVPEHRAIFRELSVRENLEIARRGGGDTEARLDLIFELFPDLKKLYSLSGGKLSGGQQQMLAIARALVPENRLLLIDEPSEGLAPVVIEGLIAAIERLARETTVLLVEQNFRMASRLADRYTIIDDGMSVQDGRMADLVHDEATVRRYLGAA